MTMLVLLGILALILGLTLGKPQGGSVQERDISGQNLASTSPPWYPTRMSPFRILYPLESLLGNVVFADPELCF